jgi:hypothetical protein
MRSVYIHGICCTFAIKNNTFLVKSLFHIAYIQRNQLDAKFLVNIFKETQFGLLMRHFSAVFYC